MSHHGHLSGEEKKKIRQERKKLRKDLKLQGITKREEFEEIARMLGLVYYEDYPRLLLLWWRFWKWFLALGALKYILMSAIALLAIFPFALLANQKGNFVVSMTDDLILRNINLTESEDHKINKITLHSDVLKEVNPFSIMDIPDNMTATGGSHNMDNVVAFTFWLVNNGDEEIDYDYYLILNNSTKDVYKATWLMLYLEEQMRIYSIADKNGLPERISGFDDAPLAEQNLDPDAQYQLKDGLYDVLATPYMDHNVVTRGSVMGLKPGEARKYTVVIWVEEKDKDCVESLIGGHAGFHMRFTAHGDEEDFNKQYDRYIEQY